MGKSYTANYEVQVDASNGKLSIQGAMSFNEAKRLLITEANRLKSDTAYIWGQTEIGRRKVKHFFAGKISDYIIVKRQDDGWSLHAGIIGEN